MQNKQLHSISSPNTTILVSEGSRSIPIIQTSQKHHIILIQGLNSTSYGVLHLISSFEPFWALKPFKLTQVIAIFCFNAFLSISSLQHNSYIILNLLITSFHPKVFIRIVLYHFTSFSCIFSLIHQLKHLNLRFTFF